MNTTQKYDKLITQAEYARMKGISRARVNQMINEGKLTPVYVRGIKLIFLENEPEKNDDGSEKNT